MYAVKVVDKVNTSPTSMKAEIDVMSVIHHDNIVNFKEIFDTQRFYYVVLE